MFELVSAFPNQRSVNTLALPTAERLSLAGWRSPDQSWRASKVIRYLPNRRANSTFPKRDGKHELGTSQLHARGAEGDGNVLEPAKEQSPPEAMRE